MVSVIMPVKNGAEKIERAIQSVLNQSYQNFELIVVDDGSTDSTPQILSRIAATTNKIRIIRNDISIGVGASLNLALLNATHELVARMDADDESTPHRLALQIEFLNQNPNVAVVGGQVLIMGKTAKMDFPLHYETNGTLIPDKILRYSVLSHPTVMYRRSIILKVGGYREFFKNAEDYDLWLRLVQNGYAIANLPERLIRYYLSVKGATIANRWTQYIYHRIAQHSHQHPHDPLDQELYKKIEKKYEHLKARYISATYLLTIEWLLKIRDYENALELYEMLPNKMSIYNLKRTLVALFAGLFRIDKKWNLAEFYTPYSIG